MMSSNRRGGISWVPVRGKAQQLSKDVTNTGLDSTRADNVANVLPTKNIGNAQQLGTRNAWARERSTGASWQPRNINNTKRPSIQHYIVPPLRQGSNRIAQAGSSSANLEREYDSGSHQTPFDIDEDEDEDRKFPFEDEDDDDLMSDDPHFDSNERLKNHEIFKLFFEELDGSSVAQLKDPSLTWRCPACTKSAHSAKKYKLQADLLSHAKGRRSSRVKIHQEFAKVLEVELLQKGVLSYPPGEKFANWEGLWK